MNKLNECCYFFFLHGDKHEQLLCPCLHIMYVDLIIAFSYNQAPVLYMVDVAHPDTLTVSPSFCLQSNWKLEVAQMHSIIYSLVLLPLKERLIMSLTSIMSTCMQSKGQTKLAGHIAKYCIYWLGPCSSSLHCVVEPTLCWKFPITNMANQTINVFINHLPIELNALYSYSGGFYMYTYIILLTYACMAFVNAAHTSMWCCTHMHMASTIQTMLTVLTMAQW